MSLVNDEEATRSCESAVDIAAATIAASKKPAIIGGNISCAKTMNISCWFFGNKLPANELPLPSRKVLPKTAIAIALPSVITTQTIATVDAFLTGDGTEAALDSLKELIAYIDRNYADPTLQNSTIAEKFGYHPYYLGSLFQKCTGTTLHDFLTQTRLQHAMRLLTDGRLSISEVAFLCGYSGAAYFSEIFLANTGLTPSDYRKLSRWRPCILISNDL